MNRAHLDVDALVVESPCTVPWASMAGDDLKRFCGQCRLHVHDVSAMTRDEVRALLVATNGECCLRLWRRPDGRVVTKECQRVRRAIRRRVAALRAAAAGLLALLGLGGCSRAEESKPPSSSGDAGKEATTLAGHSAAGAAKPPKEEPPVKGATVFTGK